MKIEESVDITSCSNVDIYMTNWKMSFSSSENDTCELTISDLPGVWTVEEVTAFSKLIVNAVIDFLENKEC